MRQKTIYILTSVVFFIVFLTVGTIIGTSFDTLNPNEAGLRYSKVNKNLDTNHIYLNGRYWVGVGRAFFKYPLTLQMIEFSSRNGADLPGINVPSSSGMVTVDVSLQYQLLPNHLVDLYQSYEFRYHDRLVKIAQQAISEVISDITPADRLYTDRPSIKQQLQAALAPLFELDYAQLHDVQLRRVRYPSQNEQQFVATLISQQAELTRLNDRFVQEIEAQASVIESEYNRLIDIYQANKTREANIIVSEATAQRREMVITAESLVYNVFRDTLNLTNAELLRFIYIQDQIRRVSSETTLSVGINPTAKL